MPFLQTGSRTSRICSFKIWCAHRSKEAIKNIRIPKNVTDLPEGFAETAKCLHALNKKNGVWNWTPECDHAFPELRNKLIHSPILRYPDVDGGPFVLNKNASDDAIDCVLSQIQNGEEK